MISYKVLPGDSLFKIKKKLGIPVSIDDIVKANPIIKDRDLIQPGWTLSLPESLPEIKALKRIEKIEIPKERGEGFGPIKGPKGEEYFPPTARGLKEKHYEVPPTLRQKMAREFQEGIRKIEGEAKEKKVTLKELLPYFPEALKETVSRVVALPGVKQVYKSFEWWNEKVYKPAIQTIIKEVKEIPGKPMPSFKLGTGDIAAIKKAERFGILEPAYANAYFERDMRGELTFGDFVQVKLLKDRVLATETARLLRLKK